MIARYAGSCTDCGATIEKGIDCDYDAEKKRIRHWQCPSEAGKAAGEGQILLTERLNYRPHGEWTMQLLHGAPDGAAAGRDGAAAFGRDAISEMPTSDTVDTITGMRGNQGY